MKKLLSVLIAGGMLAGCGKDNTYSTDFASVNFINASTSLTNVAPRPGAVVFVDTSIKVSGPIGYRGSSGYLGVYPGARNVEIRSAVARPFTTILQSASENFETNRASTIVLYDTSSATNNVKWVRLSDDLSLPGTNSVKVRFLHLANNAPAVDVTLVRTSVTPNDSATITNRSYIGASPNGASLSPFIEIPQGAYTLRVKLAGTQTVVLSTSLANILNVRNGIYTLYAAGTTGGQALTPNVFRHFP